LKKENWEEKREGGIMPISKSEKVLVTGGTGFLGAYIIRELVSRGYSVRGIRRKNQLPFFIPPSFFQKVEWVEGDILDIAGLEDAMSGVNAVIHAAAMVSLIAREKSAMFKTNIEGTTNLVNAALAQNMKRLIHVSSVAVLGRSDQGQMLSEGEQWGKINLNTNYAISKYYGEMEVWRAIGEGLNAAIVNPSTIIGYGDWNVSSCAIFKHVYRESPWYTNGVNGFVSVEDAAKAIVLLMESDISGERFILSAENWPFRQLLDTIADGFLKKHPWIEAGNLSAQFAWRFDKIRSMLTGGRPLLTKESARLARDKTYFDNSKILSFFPGFTFKPLRDSLTEACTAYLQCQS
jgi:nucleoside-diphosphate-sugar epimerase